MARILINGLGRSGTSWVHKTFDQHPNVFASHEPEALVDPALVRRLQEGQDDAAARDYINALFSCRGLRAMRKRPILKKPYRSLPAHILRNFYIYTLSLLGKAIPSANNLVLSWYIPDFSRMHNVTQVVKSVSQQSLLARIARLEPGMKIIYLIRHPCGQVYSHMRGLSSGKMFDNYLPSRLDMDRLFDFEKPAEDLVEADFSQIEINAYRWAVFNDVNYQAMSELPNVRIVTYEDLCVDPKGMFKEIIEWSGLEFHENCENFIEKSLMEGGEKQNKGYHDLVRNPVVAANRWKEGMDLADVKTVKDICSQSSAAVLFKDLGKIDKIPSEQRAK